jgi:hypothetical protein
LPGNGWIFLDVRKDLPDLWELFRRSRRDRESERSSSPSRGNFRSKHPAKTGYVGDLRVDWLGHMA